ncbi:MAG TPA: ankyrin repeat domain-containing protein [Streptosporangiales bacterium]
MSTLPARPDLDQLRRRAKDLVRAARAGDGAAIARIAAVSRRPTLTAARLAIAREHGFASWAALKLEIEARASRLDAAVEAFCEASVADGSDRAPRMLAARPEIATHGLAPALLLGDVDRVAAALAREPGTAVRVDPRWGWTPLHAVCSSRWHRFDPSRAAGLTAVARLLLDAGADPSARTAGRRGGWTPLRCAVAGAANPAVVRLLLDAGAVPDEHDLYLACFGGDGHESLRLLLSRASGVDATTALAAPISTDDAEGVRLLLDAGADPRGPLPAELFGERRDGEPPVPALNAAITRGCGTELVELLLAYGADPDSVGPDGRTPHQLAARRGRADLARLVRRHGGRADATETDLFLSSCLRADRRDATLWVERGRVHVGALGDDDLATLVRAAADANTEAVRLMLDLGFDVHARGDDGGTALHAAAYAGSVDVVRLLLEHGADVAATDPTWDATPLSWAAVGSGERPARAARPDWVATARVLLDAGASAAEVSTDGPKRPSDEVADLLDAYR